MMNILVAQGRVDVSDLRINVIVAAILIISACGTTSALAYGFFDQGFTQTPVVRTDYFSNIAGTARTPLQVSPCHFGQNPCPTLRTVWPQSNYWAEGFPANCSPFYNCPNYWWTLIMNNEPREASGNSGPADVSLPRYWPGGGGIMGFSTLYGNDNFPGDTYWRAHLVLSAYPTNPVVGAIPYLGFGAFANGGNRWPIGALNPSNAPYIPEI